MAAELFLGLPLFPGASEHDLLVRIVEMLGPPPAHVLAKAAHTRKYFAPAGGDEQQQQQPGTPGGSAPTPRRARHRVRATPCACRCWGCVPPPAPGIFGP